MIDTNQKDPFDIEPNKDGMYEIEIDNDVFTHLETLRIDPNESHADIIKRALDEWDQATGAMTPIADY